MSAGAGDRTEKATPKRRAEARKKGQVAKSADLNGAVVLLATLLALSTFGPRLVNTLETSMRETLLLVASPDLVEQRGLAALLLSAGQTAILATAPIGLAALAAGLIVNVAQVRLKVSPQAIKPDVKKINPLTGAKNLFNPQHFAFETGKSVAKVTIVGVIAGLAVLPKLPEFAVLVGLPPEELGRRLTATILDIAQRAGIAYLVIAAADFAYQRWRHDKQLKMTKQEVKEEHKEQTTPPEVRAALRRRQMQAAQRRMMAAVPEADVVVTNPTHYAVALRYDGAKAAPEVVAKGKDLIAARIRQVARDAGVPVISDPPLARALHRTVEVGHLIPEDLFQAVAQLLAFVYRAAGRRALA